MEVTDKILYLGSPCQFGYGDAGRERGFWILDTEKDSLRYVPNTISRRFHVIRDGKIGNDIRGNDYVRVEGTVHPSIRKSCEWVEADAPDVKNAPLPRLDFSQQDSQDKIVRTYYQHVLGPDKKDRVGRLTKMTMEAFEQQ
jgi:hypothetical protein